MASADGAPQAGPMPSSSFSSSSRDTEMATKLQSTTSLTIRTLQKITDNFSERRKIGQGAYGKVYVAKLENGEEIAVKMLYNNTPGIDDEQFKSEFENLMRLEHQNIVQLVRYCYETQHEPMRWMGKNIWTERTYRALCFEYMQNGSLEKHIFDECDGLDWVTRYKIIKGTCQGLKHLHGLREPIYHLDLKPDNILLDKNMVPKLADFGLSKLFSDKHTMITHSHVGTIGYVPMEFLHGNIISNKFDVFSLGVVMIKIIAGHGGYSKSAEMPRQEFLNLVQKNWRNRMLETGQVSRPLEAYCEQVNICTEIALSSMEIDRHNRPTTADTVHRLNDTEIAVEKALSWRTVLMNENMVKIEAFTKSEVIPYADMADEYPILVRVTAPPWHHAEEMSRSGVDLVLVINADCFLYDTKDAMIIVMNRLGSNDRLSVVSANGNCIMKLTFMSDRARSSVRHMVDKLVRRGFRNQNVTAGKLVLSVGEAAKLLRGLKVEEGHSRVGFIMVLFIFLEGDLDTLVQKTSSEFPVHILNLDDQRCNHKVASYIADQNSGTYSTVEGNKNGGLELFIDGVTRVTATSMDITLTAHEGVAISSIDSGGYISHVNSEGQSGEIHINDIYAGETKNFIVKLKLTEGKGKLVTIGGQYRSLNAIKLVLADTDVIVLRPRSGYSPEKLAMHPEVATELLRLQVVKGLRSILQQDFMMYDEMEVLWGELIKVVRGG